MSETAQSEYERKIIADLQAIRKDVEALSAERDHLRIMNNSLKECIDVGIAEAKAVLLARSTASAQSANTGLRNWIDTMERANLTRRDVRS